MARHSFAKAVRWKLLATNPFDGIRAGNQENSDRKFYVSRETIQRIIDQSTDPEFRLILALCRFAGLRCPSEHLALKWAHVDWARGHLTVPSPKTEHHPGRAFRVIPLFADLQPYLRQVFEQAKPGAVYVISEWREKPKNLRTRFLTAIIRAGGQPWPRIFQNLRASCETDLVRKYPLVTVAGRLGHTPSVMVTNYLTNPDLDADFTRAAMPPDDPTREATRRAEERGGARGNEEKVAAYEPPEIAVLRNVSPPTV